MVCPYAKNIRGLVVYCEAARKKVSSLRYPCKGDYKKCPIYRRAQRAARREEKRAAKPEKPAPPRPVEAPVPREEKLPAPTPAPQPPAPGPAPASPVPAVAGAPTAGEEAPVASTSGGVVAVAAAPPEETSIVGSGRAACDSLVAAELLIVAQYLRARTGPLRSLVEEIAGDSGKEGGGVVLFFTGDVKGVGRVRGVAYGGRVTSFYFEKAGERYCGREAWEKAVGEAEAATIRIYRVELDRVPDNIARVLRAEIG